MFELSELSSDELVELKADLQNEIADRRLKHLHANLDFFTRVSPLKENLLLLANKKIALNIEGEDIFVRLEFKNGFTFCFDEMDASPSFELDKYNEESYEQLYIEGRGDAPGELCNFYVPLFCDFVFSTNHDILKDEPDEVLDYDHIVFVLRLDTIDYIFTEDVAE